MTKTSVYYYSLSSDPVIDSLLDLLPLEHCEISLLDLAKVNVSTKINPNSILVSVHTSTLRFVSLMERRGYRYGVMVLGDENLEDNLAYVNNTNCLFVASEYYNPEANRLARSLNNCSKLLSIRGRCNNEFYRLSNNQKKKKERTITWFFAGDVISSGSRGISRLEPITEFRKISGGEWIDTDQGFISEAQKETALTTGEYFQKLNNSYFALCPKGWVNLDTYRFYEALDAGCIPVVLRSPSGPWYHTSFRSYWGLKFGLSDDQLPFVVAESWEEARLKVSQIIESGKLHDVQQSTWCFWEKIKSSWRQSLSEFRNELSESDTTYRNLGKSVAHSPW